MISGVSGTVGQGNALIISGSTLIGEVTTNYHTRWRTTYPTAGNFEGATPAADGWWDEVSGHGAYSAAVKLLGSQSMSFDLVGSGSENGNALYLYDSNGLSMTSDAWMRFYYRLHRTGSGWFQNTKAKAVYLQSQNGGSIWAPYPDSAWGGWAIWGASGVMTHFTDSRGNINPDQWYCIELHIHNSAPCQWTLYVDGQQLGSTVTGESATAPVCLELGWGASELASGTTVTSYWDGFATGSARLNPLCLVEIAPQSQGTVYASVTTKRAQALTALAETSVEITCDLTGLGAGPYRLWLTNNAGQSGYYDL